MPRLSTENTLLAKEIISRYPVPKSALIPLLHLAQEQDGYVSGDAMEHLAELVDVTPAEVVGTCSFYEMFKLEPVGDYLVNVCTNISCQLNGGEELLHHLEGRLGIRPGSTTPDGTFTLEDVECIAACTEAPCLQVNYRYVHQITHDEVDALLDDLKAGRRSHEVPKHGTLARVRQAIPADRRAGAALPTESIEPPWLGGPSIGGEHPEPEATEAEQQSPEEQPDGPAAEHAADAEQVSDAPADDAATETDESPDPADAAPSTAGDPQGMGSAPPPPGEPTTDDITAEAAPDAGRDAEGVTEERDEGADEGADSP